MDKTNVIIAIIKIIMYTYSIVITSLIRDDGITAQLGINNYALTVINLASLFILPQFSRFVNKYFGVITRRERATWRYKLQLQFAIYNVPYAIYFTMRYILPVGNKNGQRTRVVARKQNDTYKK